MRTWLVIALFALGLSGSVFVITQTNWSEALLLLSQAQQEYLFVYLFASLCILSLLAARWYVIVRSQGINVSFQRLFAFSLVRAAVSFVTPGPRVGGDAVAAGLLAKRGEKKTSLASAVSTLAIDRALEFQTFSFLFFSGVLLFTIRGELPLNVKTTLIIFSSVCLFFALAVTYGLLTGKFVATQLVKRFAKNPALISSAHEFEQTLQRFYRKQPKFFFSATLASVIAWLCSLLEFWALLSLLGLSVPLWGIFVVYSFVGFAYLVPIPFALGSLESLLAAAFALLVLPQAAGVLVVLITRARDATTTLIGFMLLGYYGLPRKTA